MSNKIVLNEGNNAFTFGDVNKIVIPKKNGGNTIWIPEENVNTTSLFASENGVYNAQFEGYSGYDSVYVDVPSKTSGLQLKYKCPIVKYEPIPRDPQYKYAFEFFTTGDFRNAEKYNEYGGGYVYGFRQDMQTDTGFYQLHVDSQFPFLLRRFDGILMEQSTRDYHRHVQSVHTFPCTYYVIVLPYFSSGESSYLNLYNFRVRVKASIISKKWFKLADEQTGRPEYTSVVAGNGELDLTIPLNNDARTRIFWKDDAIGNPNVRMTNLTHMEYNFDESSKLDELESYVKEGKTTEYFLVDSTSVQATGHSFPSIFNYNGHAWHDYIFGNPMIVNYNRSYYLQAYGYMYTEIHEDVTNVLFNEMNTGFFDGTYEEYKTWIKSGNF